MTERDYGPLVRSALGATLTVVAAKLSAIVSLANLQGTQLDVQLAGGVLPYLQVVAEGPAFSSIVTWSTVAMGAMAVLQMLGPALRGGATPDLVTGRLIAVVVVAETTLLEVARHFLGDPVLLWNGVGITAALVAAACGLELVAQRRAIVPFDRDRAQAPIPTRAAAPIAPEPTPPQPLELPPDPFAWEPGTVFLDDDELGVDISERESSIN